ncbi:MAG TPA: hypothetical protein VMM78_19080, partial [Thermomicrobiales bacterium]|nr:hypothetical protein [Thermomicrobiales bacterium]
SGGLAAFVQTRRSGDEETQEVRFISVEGFVTGAVYGPVTTAGPDAEPEIVELAWSWDASSLAILRADGAIEALVGLDDPFFDSSVPLPLIPASRNQISAVTWGPTGDGIAYLMAGADGRHHLMVAPRDVQPIDVLATDGGRVRTVADFEWLPGRGRVAFVEDSRVPGSRAPASIFTIVPNGTALELLVSASRFAPAATIGKMNASPDARELAFFLYAPDAQGRPEFQTLWVLHIDSGELREIPVEPGYVVTDTWFMSGGLLWRGVDLGSTSIDAGTTYTGVEPFILAFTDAEGATSILFQSTLVEDE